MIKRIAVLGFLWLICLTAIHGGGRGENETHSAETPEGFTDSIPIETKKKGKWNFFMEAFDKGGNSVRFGPHNIYNDPVSDLPIITIINPKVNMHIQGNLSIVGISADDDGVDHVELTVTRGPGGKGEEIIRARAEGGVFWSYYVDTTDEAEWPDGVYTITAWGVDINGLSGISEDFKARDHKKHVVSWNLDRKKPKNRIASHDIGALVAGKINLKGSVYDGNTVKSLSYSLDGGKRYLPISLKHDRRTYTSSWNLNIDTRTMEEGPQVIWFKSFDGMGTMGLDAHLLFVNNTSPEVKIMYPDPEIPVGGVFSIAIYANHPVGLKAVTWRLGKDSGEFPLIIGNSWYTQEFDIRGLKASSVDLEIRAEDLTGNVTYARRKMAVDQNATLPIITLESPVANAVVGKLGDGQGLAIKGVARTGNNDPIASVLYSLNGNPAVEVPSTGIFQIMATDLPAGTITLDVWAKSIAGIEGPKVNIKGITVPGAVPAPRLTTVRTGSGRTAETREFYSGIEIVPDARTVVEFSVTAAAPITAATLTFAGQPAVAVNLRADRESGAFRADVPVPVGMREGLTEIELRATDRNGGEGVFTEYAYIGTSRIPEFRWVRPNQNAEGQIRFTAAGETLLALTGSTTVNTVRLTGSGSDNIRAEVDAYGRVQLTAVGEGDFGPLTLSINSGSQNSREFRVLADFGGPSITVQPPPRWVQKSVPLQFTVADGSAVALVEYSLDLGGAWTPLLNPTEVAALRPRGFANFVERNLDISALEDGQITILIRAVDRINNTAVANVTVQKDNVAPRPELILPIAEASVNGTIRLAIAVEEAGTLSSVTYIQGANRRQVYVEPETNEGYYIPRFFDIRLDAAEMPLRENMVFEFLDAAGNRAELREWPFIIDNEMDIPVAHITLPLEGETIIADFEVSGVMFDDDAIKQVYWRIDNNAEQILETGNGFAIPIALSSLTDNEHKVTVVAEDIYGVKSEPVTRNFRVSLSEPIGVVTAPAFDILAGGLVEMSGGAYDDNGIAKVQVSLDSGNSFDDTRLNAYGGTAEWFFEFNTVILPDGPNVVFLRVTDKYDISAIYASLLNVDNTLPTITLDSPTDGVTTTGHINILGQIVDVNLEEKGLQLRSLEGRPIPSGFTLHRVGQTPMLREEFDLSPLRDGVYNIEITATDKAGNETSVSRNIILSRESKTNKVDILYPLNGEYVQGSLNLYGNTAGSDKAETVTLRVNGEDVATAEVTWTGYFCFELNEEILKEGENEIIVHSDFGTYNLVLSPTRKLHYQSKGAWVTIDSLTMGDFAFDRPWFIGRAGYNLSDEDLEILAQGSKNVEKEVWDNISGKIIDYIDLSFDNGNTFIRTKKGRDANSDWSYRLETGEMKEGLHYIIVRAKMKNGELAVTRTVLQVDKTPPRIRVIAPEPGGRYNTDLEFTAIAADDVALADLEYHLRVGDKAAYEIPGFLQGLYFESVIPPFIVQLANEAPGVFAGGATYMDVGMGLSFFDDNVKIQVQYGFMFQDIFESMGGIGPVRYGGHVLGIKLLANVYTYPFAAAFGPDYEWLFGSISLGANFSLFDMANTVNEKYSPNYKGENEYYTQSGKSTWMSALLLQLELPKVSIPKKKYLRTFSMFTEGQLWFVPTDVNAEALGIETVIPHVIVGLRLYIF